MIFNFSRNFPLSTKLYPFSDFANVIDLYSARFAIPKNTDDTSSMCSICFEIWGNIRLLAYIERYMLYSNLLATSWLHALEIVTFVKHPHSNDSVNAATDVKLNNTRVQCSYFGQLTIFVKGFKPGSRLRGYWLSFSKTKACILICGQVTHQYSLWKQSLHHKYPWQRLLIASGLLLQPQFV
jgi:hypothetical protein